MSIVYGVSAWVFIIWHADICLTKHINEFFDY